MTKAMDGVIVSVLMELMIGWKIAKSNAAIPTERKAMSVFLRERVVRGTVFRYDQMASSMLARRIPA